MDWDDLLDEYAIHPDTGLFLGLLPTWSVQWLRGQMASVRTDSETAYPMQWESLLAQ